MAITPQDTADVWNISTDIYDIVDSITKLKDRYIEDENEDTLAVGIFGFLGDVEAKKIQSSAIYAAQMGNEMFPTRAKLTKNVITHAIYNNIIDINAVPATMTVNIGIKVSDLDNYMVDGVFTFDCTCPIFISDYEFHFEYDIVLVRTLTSAGTYAYSAHYNVSVPNRLSQTNDPYLKQPFAIKIENDDYVVFQAQIRQYTIETTSDKLISESIIENKTFTFEFENQIADFDVFATRDGVETRLTPLIYGSDYGDIENYCWYLFISDNTIRITFDSVSYMPGLNSDIRVEAYTTLGAAGNFTYKSIDDSDSGFYVDIQSDKYNYNKITCYMVAVTNSQFGSDKKSKAELQALIPKMAHSRGSITTEQDVINYFNLINTEDNRLVVRKKMDNQFARVWYAYFLLKDSNNNVLPTNTIKIKLNINDGTMYLAEDGRHILPAGSVIKYDGDAGIGTVIDEAEVPPIYTPEYFANNMYYYMTLYNIILDEEPLYAAYYMTISNTDQFYTFIWVNELSKLQYVVNKCNFKRSLLTDQSEYKYSFKMAQSIAADYGMYSVDPETGVVTNNMKAVIVLYREGVPYRWQEATLTNYDEVNFVSSWELSLDTDNGFDSENNIKINGLHVAGSGTDVNYGYFAPNTKAVMYILSKFDELYGRYDLDLIAPGAFNGYSVTNVYEVDGGFLFYENYTNVVNTKITPVVGAAAGTYTLAGLPVSGMHFMVDEDAVVYFTNQLNDKKAYIDNCLKLLENSMDIDFKFFNTYGNSLTYITDNESRTPIGHIDISMNFKMALKNLNDVYTKDDVTNYIKKYIENLEDIGDLHIPNLITDITNEFSSRITYIEFVNFNDFSLGIQHIIVDDLLDDIDVVPEFLNIRNTYDNAGVLVPNINIEVLYS